MAPRTVWLRHTSATSAVPSAPIARPARAGPRRRASAAGDRAQWPGEADPPLRQRRLDALEQPRRQLVEAALERLVEQDPRLRGVVMGEHDERVDPASAPVRASAVHLLEGAIVVVGAARLDARDDVDGGAPAAHEAAQDARPVLRLVDDAREGPGSEQSAEPRPAAQDERRAEHPEQAEAGRGRRERAPGGLVLERDLDAGDRA